MKEQKHVLFNQPEHFNISSRNNSKVIVRREYFVFTHHKFLLNMVFLSFLQELRYSEH